MNAQDDDFGEYLRNQGYQFQEDLAIIDMYFNSDEISKDHKQKDSKTRKIKLNHEGKNYELNAHLIAFSQLLAFAFNEDGQQDHQTKKNTDDSALYLDFPKQIPINSEVIAIVEKFMQVSGYNPASVKLGKVKPYSFKINESCQENIKNFIVKHIKILPNSKMTELIQFCRYLQLNSLLEVIYYHLATKYSCPYTEMEAQELLEKYRVKKLDNKNATDIKIKYVDYFKKLSSEFIEIEEERRLEAEAKNGKGKIQ